MFTRHTLRAPAPFLIVILLAAIGCHSGAEGQRLGLSAPLPAPLPLDNLNAIQLRFFESGYTACPFGHRNYRTRFERRGTRYIYWELRLNFSPPKRDIYFNIDAIWFRSDGRILAKDARRFHVKPNWTRFRVCRGWGARSGSWWLPGAYRVVLYVEGRELAEGKFEVEGSDRKPPRKPFLRLDTGMHTASTWELDVDADNRYMVTGANDKTVRVWDLINRRLLRTLRPPIGEGKEGAIGALAISPDGRAVACGGRTGCSWEGTCSVYIFETQSGKLIRRIKGFAGPIKHIDYSRQGRYLAIAYRNGLAIYRIPTYDLIGRDEDYPSQCTSVDFGPGRRIASVSPDGFVRLYRVRKDSLKLISKRKYPHDRPPYCVQYAPDGKKLAIGYWSSKGYWAQDTPKIDVISGVDLQFLYSPDTSGLTHGLEPVTWSQDGRCLYAGGYPMTWAGKRMAPVIRWAKEGRGTKTVFPADNDAIQDIFPLKNGGIVFVAHNTAWGVLDSAGRKVYYHRPCKADFRGYMNIPSSMLKTYMDQLASQQVNASQDQKGWLEEPAIRGFPISEDATKVIFSFEAKGRQAALFDVAGRSLQLNPLWKNSYLLPILESPRLKVTGWCGKANPKLNGRRLRLGTNEISWCLAISPNDGGFLLGTEWNLYHFDQEGHKIWRTPLDSAAWAVNISKDSRIAVLHLADGTIRWYRMIDGNEILAFFPHADRNRWIAWTPEGYYMSSPYGDELVGWHLNNGKDQEAHFYAAMQFERILFQPAYVQSYFRYLGNRKEAAKMLGGPFFDINDLRSIAPPRVEIGLSKPSGRGRSNKIELVFKADKQSLPMESFAVFVNDIPVIPSTERLLIGKEQNQFSRQLEIPVQSRRNNIRVEVFNGRSMGLAHTSVPYDGNTIEAKRGDLYLLAVGVNHFPKMPSWNLTYAVQDAVNIAALFSQQKGRIYHDVHHRVISDRSGIKPQKTQILASLDFIADAGANDTVIVFLASHGVSDLAGNYYFVPSDAEIADIQRVENSRRSGQVLPEAGVPSLVPWKVFFDALRATAGRRILIVDTCQARAISGPLDIHALAKKSLTSAFALLAASKGDESSQEYPEGRHGLFTYALLKGLLGDGDRDNDRQVTLKELYEFARRFVESKRDRSIGRQTPQLASPSILKDIPLSFCRRRDP